MRKIGFIIFIIIMLLAGYLGNSRASSLDKEVEKVKKQIKKLKSVSETKSLNEKKLIDAKLSFLNLKKEVLLLKIESRRLSKEATAFSEKSHLADPDIWLKNKIAEFDKKILVRKFSVDDTNKMKLILSKRKAELKQIETKLGIFAMQKEKITKNIENLKERDLKYSQETNELEKEIKKQSRDRVLLREIVSIFDKWKKQKDEYQKVAEKFVKILDSFTAILEKKKKWLSSNILLQKYKLDKLKGKEIVTEKQFKLKKNMVTQRLQKAGRQELNRALEFKNAYKKIIQEIENIKQLKFTGLKKNEVCELADDKAEYLSILNQLKDLTQKTALIYENTSELKKMILNTELEHLKVKKWISDKKLSKSQRSSMADKYLKEYEKYMNQAKMRFKEAEEAYKLLESAFLVFNNINDSYMLLKERLIKKKVKPYLLKKKNLLKKMLKAAKELKYISEIYFLSHYLNKIQCEKLAKTYRYIAETLAPPPGIVQRTMKKISIYFQTTIWPGLVKVISPLFIIIVILLICKVLNMISHKIFDVTGALTRKMQEMNIATHGIDTFRNLARSAITYTIYGVGIVMVLKQLGVSPNLSVGGIGVFALITTTFGKNVLENFLSGLFMILENRYSVGDFIEAGGVSGFVEEVSLRTTTIRKVNGEVQIIPNGMIKTVRKFPDGHEEARVDIYVKREDAEAAKKILDNLSRCLEKELEFVLKVPEFVPLNLESNEEYFIRYIITTLPDQEWIANEEFVKRARFLLKENGIEIKDEKIRVSFLTNVKTFKSRLQLLKEKVKRNQKEEILKEQKLIKEVKES